MGSLKVSKFNDGSIIRTKDGSEYGTVMLISETTGVNANGFIEKRKRIAFIKDKVESLEAFNFVEGMDFNAKLKSMNGQPMRIVVRESLEPAFEGQQPKQNPQTGEVISTADGQPIYYNTQLVLENSEECDYYVPTGNPVVEAQATATAEAGDLA